jgi:hypothetical protein
MIWLTGQLAPDFKTIADFRKDNGKAIREVCREFVALCRKLALLSAASVAIDGSKFKAVNARDKASTGPNGSPVFAYAGKTDPPSRLILSQTSAGKLRLSYVIDSSSFWAVPLFVPWRPLSRPARADAPRARGRQGWPSRGPCLALPCCQATP